MEWDIESILKLGRGFQQARIFLSAVELDIFSKLKDSSKTALQIAQDLSSDKNCTEILLNALVALELLEKNEELFQLKPELKEFLTSDGKMCLLPMLKHSANMWQTWSKLTEIVKKGRIKRKVIPKRKGKDLEAFIGGMHCLGVLHADRIVKIIDPKGYKNLIDVGGASGTYTIAFLKANPEMKATLFDLPPVIKLAKKRIKEAGLLKRVKFVGGDFYKDNLPKGYDLAYLSAIIHQNSLDENKALYKKVFTSLIPGGHIIIRDHVMDESRTIPADGALFAVNMLVGTSGGSTYTFNEIKEGLEYAGFTNVTLINKEGMFSLVSALKPI